MLFVFLAIVVAFVVIKLVKVSLFWSNRNIPYEPYWRYLHRVLWEMHRRPVIDLVKETGDRYGPLYGSYKGISPVLVTTDIEVIKEVCIKKFDCFFKRSFEIKTGEPLWDNTLLQLPYDQWKALRTIMGCTFTTAKLRGMSLKLDLITKRILNKFSRTANSEISLSKDLLHYSLDSMAAIALGMDLNSIENTDLEFIQNVTRLLRPGFTAVVFFVAPGLMRYIPFLDFPPKRSVKFITGLAKHVLEEKRQNLDEVIKNGTADILDLHLIQQREDPNSILNDAILSSQAFLFLVGSDNTKLLLELTILYLTLYPECQQRAFEEVKSAVGQSDAVSYEQLQKMKYIEACILEAARLIPVASALDRICNSETTVAGQHIHKGMTIEFNMPHIHYNPNYFSEPDTYKPERFLKDDEDSVKDLTAFMVFGLGPKNCVGKRLALMNLEILLAGLLLKFKLEATENTPTLPIKAKPGIHFYDVTEKPIVLKLVPRDKTTPE